jgi:hypothetical protein
MRGREEREKSKRRETQLVIGNQPQGGLFQAVIDQELLAKVHPVREPAP